ncbi:hypothetical protein PET01_09340 [Pediococcus ethanolidurans]|uniref:Uncharacterized protein n=1 Tax=Pediococcus ethanolidurans TaxID=319653 RepID=A0A1H9PD72_9LACO|nr:hypothetical protein PET01_09340 [Pediococcus ethanolidurans]SER46108.1 hypothetical protein SAMN04487973_10732 [Pediococcus ethanolidurans]
MKTSLIISISFGRINKFPLNSFLKFQELVKSIFKNISKIKKNDWAVDKLTVKEYGDHFKG